MNSRRSQAATQTLKDELVTRTMSVDDQTRFDTLQARLAILLPEEYSGQEIQPVSMGSAGLRFKPDGTVAWDEIWATFCHLAMAGGPPHRGTLLEPGPEAEIGAHSGRHRQVVDEICRGITLATGLDAERSRVDGWVRVECSGAGMAGWLTRAIAMENVSVRCEGSALQLPAGPHYRLEREIKNVITAIAKTCHYWRDHMDASRRQTLADLLAEMERESPLIQPALAGDDPHLSVSNLSLSSRIAATLQSLTGLESSNPLYAGWLGIDCQSIPGAIWRMRLLAASNLLSRREGTIVFVPVNPAVDPEGEVVVRSCVRIHRFVVGTYPPPPCNSKYGKKRS